MRGTRLSLGTHDPVVSEPGRVYLRGPARADRDEFVTLMRKSRSFHRPWATAPTDDARFDAYLTDARRPDFEAMLVCRLEDDAIVGFFNLSQIARGSLQSASLGYAVGKPYARHGYMRDGLSSYSGSVPQSAPPPRRGEHSARQQSVGRTRPGSGISPRGVLAPVPEDRWPVARSRALGDSGGRVAGPRGRHPMVQKRHLSRR